MATLTIVVPDAIVPELARALALRMNVPPPTTPQEAADLARAFMKQEAKRALLDLRAQEAAQTTRDDITDPAVQW